MINNKYFKFAFEERKKKQMRFKFKQLTKKTHKRKNNEEIVHTDRHIQRYKYKNIYIYIVDKKKATTNRNVITFLYVQIF